MNTRAKSCKDPSVCNRSCSQADRQTGHPHDLFQQSNTLGRGRKINKKYNQVKTNKFKYEGDG